MCTYCDRNVYIKQPDPIRYLIMCKKRDEAYQEAKLSGSMTDDDIFNYICSHDMWSLDQQKELDNLPTVLENLKSELYLAYEQFRKRDTIKRSINSCKQKFYDLLCLRHTMDEYSCEGIASFTKNIYMIGYGARTIDNEYVWKDDRFLVEDYDKILLLIKQYNSQIVDDDTIRALSQSTEWQNIWSIGKTSRDIFDIPSTLYMTEEQKSLIGWTQLYTNIKSHPECPDDVVFEDNDMLDGWLIVQNKKQSNKPKTKQGVDKYGNATEVFVMVENPEDIQRVNALNTAQGKMIKKQRLAMVEKMGSVSEENFPDARQSMIQQALQAQTQGRT